MGQGRRLGCKQGTRLACLSERNLWFRGAVWIWDYFIAQGVVHNPWDLDHLVIALFGQDDGPKGELGASSPTFLTCRPSSPLIRQVDCLKGSLLEQRASQGCIWRVQVSKGRGKLWRGRIFNLKHYRSFQCRRVCSIPISE